MCGIVGYLNLDNKPSSLEILKKMNQSMFSRGPDDEGYYLNASYGMAMRRLSIIDIKLGKQPIYNKNKSKILIFNGEIYNYLELRKELEKKGILFKTNSDTEVIIELYQMYGDDFLKYLNGMFALCIFDCNNNSIFIARDRFGIKPIFYYLDQKVFTFSSSINALKLNPFVKTSINYSNLISFFSSSYISNPESIYNNIVKLKPGHYLKFKNNELIINKYWNLQVSDDNKKKINYNNYIYEIKELLDESIKINSRSDVDIGTFLSGGLDSTYITKQLSNLSNKKINTFTASFPFKINNESILAKESSKLYNTNHFELEIDKKSIFDSFNNFIPNLDEPIADSAIIPSYLLSKFALKNNIKVILTGAGGDEIFGGYSRYYKRKKDFLTGIYANLPVQFVLNVSSLFSHKYFDYNVKLINSKIDFAINTSGLSMSIFNFCLNKKSDLNIMINSINDKFSHLNKLKKDKGYSYGGMITDIDNYLVDDILALTDKSSMDQSVEIRVPFLDHRLVEKIFSVPQNINISSLRHKNTLHNIINNELPNNVINNPKTGFNAPILEWFRILDSEFDDFFSDIKSPILNEIFDVKKIYKIWKNESTKSIGSEFLFMILILHKWLEKNE